MSRSRICLLLASVAALALSASPLAHAGSVQLDSLLASNRVYVATTEDPESIMKYFVKWRCGRLDVQPISDQAKYIKGAVLVLVVDRGKCGDSTSQSDTIKLLTPLAASAIGNDQVVVYAGYCHKRWTVLISAPSEQWLQRALTRINKSAVLAQGADTAGTMLDHYTARRIQVVSTEGEQLAKDWVKLQCAETREYEPLTCPIDKWSPEMAAEVNTTAFLLNRQEISDRHASVISSLPKDMQSWIARDASRSEIAVEKLVVDLEGGRQAEVCAVVAPSDRLLQVTLSERFRKMAELPAECRAIGLCDLRDRERIITVARPGNRSDKDKKELVNDLAGKLTTALGSIGGGFQCETRQDLAEVTWASEMESTKPTDSKTGLASKIKDNQGLALAVADLTTVTSRTEYQLKSLQCLTSPLPPFNKPQPKEPARPKPEDLTNGSSGPRKYSDGIKDAKFKNDLLNWQNVLMPQFGEQMRQWAMEGDAYEASRQTHEMEWTVALDAIESATTSGNLRIYDLTGYKSLDACKVLFSCDLKGDAIRRAPFKTDRITAMGEAARPNVQIPEPRSEADGALVSEAISRACGSAANHLRTNALLPVDRAPLHTAEAAK